MNICKWLYLGIGIKSCLYIIVGFILINTGIVLLVGLKLLNYSENIIYNLIFFLGEEISNIMYIIIALLFIIVGIIFIIWALKSIVKDLLKDALPGKELLDVLYQKRVLQKGPKVVALGGGTGLSNLLRGLKDYTSNITAIVTVADDGGSSGILRDEFDMLPPGDIRNCLVALADTEPLMKELFQYRFISEGKLLGHNFGNLFIVAMSKVTGDFVDAIKESSKVLAIRGKVLPSTTENIRLGAVFVDKSVVMGESNIPCVSKKIDRVFLEPESCQPLSDTLNAIREADIIVIGPGSLYTSILPNLLVEEISNEIRRSRAKKIYVANVMTQPGETLGYTVSDHIRVIIDHVGRGLFNYVIANQEEGSSSLEKKYKEEGAFPVKVDRQQIEKEGIKLIESKLLIQEGYLRHDPWKLAKIILKTAQVQVR
jgi:uncharacterized cofD-like protein